VPLEPFKIDYNSPVTFTDQVAAEIQRQIGCGLLQPGEKLPPMREAGKILDCSAVTVNKAVMKLVNREVLASRGPRGVYVADDLTNEDVILLSDEKLIQMLSDVRKYAEASGVSQGHVLDLLNEVYQNKAYQEDAKNDT
jgi:DNA-binding transcriptional regulator YhcF (GntR family)